MFAALIGQPNASLFGDPPDNYTEAGSSWAPAAIDIDGAGSDTGLFDLSVEFSPGDYGVFAYTRTLVDPTNVIRAYIRDTEGADAAIINNTGINSVAAARGHTGIWLYQGIGVSAVPIPAAVWFFGSGLLGLAGMARRKKA